MLISELLVEGGHATAKFNVERVNKGDIRKALEFISSTLNVSIKILEKSLLGSSDTVFIGKKETSSDIDIAIKSKDNYKKINSKMMSAVNGEGYFNNGQKIGSYAVPIGDKKIQVDLMFVHNMKWAKFIYYSGQDRGSKYPGAVRNIILFTALTFVQEPGKDFVEKDKSGKVIARASRSINMNTGMERLFKISKIGENGKYSKSLDKVDPNEVEKFLKTLHKKIKFSKDPDIIDNPDYVAKFIFGDGVKSKDIMTAEDVIRLIKEKFSNSSEILNKAKKELKANKLPVPKELQ